MTRSPLAVRVAASIPPSLALSTAILLLAPVVFANPPSSDQGSSEWMTIPTAIKAINQQFLTARRENAHKMRLMAKRHRDVAQNLPEVRAALGSLMDGLNGSVIQRLRDIQGRDPQAVVYGKEVSDYLPAFRGELHLIRRAIVKESADGEGESKNWSDVLQETLAGRQEIVKPYAQFDAQHPGPVKLLDEAVGERLQKDANIGGPGQTPEQGSSPGASPQASPSASARDRLAFGDVSGAKGELARAAQSGTADSQSYALSAALALNEGRYETAVANSRQALAMDPRNAEAVTVLHFAQGRVSGSGETTATASGMTAASPSETPSSNRTAAAQEYATAGESYAQEATRLSNTTPGRIESESLRRDARAALGLGDINGALDRVNRGLALDPNNPALLNMRGSIYARMHEYGKALADANAGLALAPKSRALLTTRGFAQLRGDDAKAALATANELLESDPNDAFAYALRAHAEGQMGERDAMMADLNRAAALDPAYAAARDAAGKLQLPSDSDILFLFPGEAAPSGKTASPAPAGRGRRFGTLVGLSALGGLLLALGLLGTVLEPVRKKITSAFTRLTRSGPTVAGDELATPQPPSAAGHLPGLIRGQYEVARQIGAGGMGMVFEGTDRSLGRRVAIKKMREEIRFDPRERARFVSEAKTVAALHHPNIVDIYAIAEDGDDVYLIFEYVDGRTVHDLLQGGRLAPEEAVKIVRASAGALEFAHERGVIHRDMKPSNVMLDAQGRVKVMDFGIARVAKDAMTRRSMTNTVAGTPPYMAPEQEQGRVRKESDVYALAVCAYEMLTGRLPFVGVGAGMLMNKVNMSYVPPSKEVDGLPEALDGVFEKAFQADPDKRYASPSEFASALAAALPNAARNQRTIS